MRLKTAVASPKCDFRIQTDPLPPSRAVKLDASMRLKQANSLYDQGLIIKDDCDREVKKILDSMELRSNSKIWFLSEHLVHLAEAVGKDFHDVGGKEGVDLDEMEEPALVNLCEPGGFAGDNGGPAR